MLFQEAEALLEAQLWDQALERYRQALAAHPSPPPRWRVRASRAAARSGDLDLATTLVSDAIAAADGEPPTGWLVRLARLSTARRDFAAARSTWTRALESEGASPLHHRLLAKDVAEFHERRRVARFVESRIDRIRARADAGPGRGTPAEGPLFTLWFQGFDDAPPLVQACQRQLRRVSARDLVRLDDANLAHFAELPASLDLSRIGTAHRSDLLRLELLARHGGTWLDATVLVRDDFDQALADVMGAGFFAFDKRASTLSNWLMSVDAPGHHAVRLMRAALHTWWEEEPANTPYLVFHHLFAVLLEVDDTLRALWEATPTVDYTRAHRIFVDMASPYDEETFARHVSAAFAQKLTYKYDASAATGDTMLQHVLTAY